MDENAPPVKYYLSLGFRIIEIYRKLIETKRRFRLTVLHNIFAQLNTEIKKKNKNISIKEKI